MKYAVLLALAMGVSAQAQVMTSEYPLGVTREATDEACAWGDEEYGSSRQCTLAGDYGVNEFGHDHGVLTELTYKGEVVELDEPVGMALGKVKEYDIPAGYDPAWYDAGTENSVYEVRKADGQPVAVIYRRIFKSWAQPPLGSDADWVIASESSVLFVIKLDGMSSELVSAVDSIAASEAGMSANVIAQQCADSFVGQANPSACDLFNALD